MLKAIYPVGQFYKHWLFNKLWKEQLVQLETVVSHVAQSPAHGSAIPEIFTYPEGTESRQVELRRIYPESQLKHVDSDEQFTQWISGIELHKLHIPDAIF